MPDIFSKHKRSEIMSKVRSKNTKPEEIVGKYLFSHGLRYRKNVKKLPGSPDLVLRKYKVVIFVNGCFWHGHDCKKGVLPNTNKVFWEEKIRKNKHRDTNNYQKLTDLGWRVLIVWECEIKNRELKESKLFELVKTIKYDKMK